MLTTPVVRSLKAAYPNCEIHFFTKPAFTALLAHNPYIDRVIELERPLWRQLLTLRKEGYDFILDLHHNLRSLLTKISLGVPARAFPKRNKEKYKWVHQKDYATPIEHIVLRYAETLQPLGVELDDKGLDVFLPEGAELEAKDYLITQGFDPLHTPLLAVVLGAKHNTKRWIPAYFVETLNQYPYPVLLIGGPDAKAEAEEITSQLSGAYLNLVGKKNLLQSAALMKQCHRVLTHDTGFMHIAAAFMQDSVVLWGNTLPAFGMSPYKTKYINLQINHLSCRPCSKIGFDSCPQGHFKCMRDLSPAMVLEALNQKDLD